MGMGPRAVSAVCIATALLTSSGTAASASTPEKCPTPSLAIFDLAVPATAKGVERLTLLSSAGGVWTELAEKDPSHSHIQLLDYEVINEKEKVGSANLPPAGALSGVDYLVSGSITGQEGSFTVTVTLEDAVTRDVIATGSATFAEAEEGLAAAERAASQLTPALDKIRFYQRQLRNSNDEIAILAEVLVRPERKRIKVGESTRVTVEALDCDGQPLKGRSIALRANHGRISASKVKTNGRGEATVTFHAHLRGSARIIADYNPYTTATHRPNRAQGEALVDVDDPLTDMYVVEATVNWNQQGNSHTTEHEPLQIETVHWFETGTARVTEVVRGDPLGRRSCDGCVHYRLLAQTVTGSFSEGKTTNTRTTYEPILTTEQTEEFQSGDALRTEVAFARAHGSYRSEVDVNFGGTELTSGYSAGGGAEPTSESGSAAAERTLEVKMSSAEGWSQHCTGSSTHISCTDRHTESFAGANTSSEAGTGTIEISIRRLRASQAL
ncbi:MAG TPA: Ig-like domain-containing protein [Solirubrobacteraceae bacterium]|nr:Ig-like domain-containing protein [Solirubrobacteraceae bacterium]